ncbi:dymeclin [Aethina tumida]|uniref:dymeclin n=1 Tax=Aethina tumida TaxID=116153 RepID=UPI0021489183|nr:dymeclin [Aethina tumida]
MGTAVSRNLDLNTNEYLEKFVGKQSISANDPFWNRFLAFNIIPPTTTNDQLVLESRIENLCQELVKNNVESGNLNSLIQLFLIKSSELLSAADSDANLFSWQVFNTLFTIRCILKFLTETVNEEQLIQHIEVNGPGNVIESLIGALVGIIVDVPVKESTYAVHLEAVTCLLIFLSVQFHSGRRSDQSNIYHLIMKGKHVIHAPVLVKCLLTNFINQEPTPAAYGTNHGQSIVLGLASELWSMLTFSKKSTENLTVPEHSDYQQAPLATHSLLLVLVLVHHWTTHSNPYRISLFSCVNSQDNNSICPIESGTLFKIDFDALYVTLCKKASGDSATLLLYLLLHRNPAFKTYLLGRLDLESLIIPILKTLYNAPNSNSHHIYMSLIILLILSEDETFNKMIHQTKLKNVLWYTERALSEVSLGGLLILVVIRTIQYNMLKMRDKYLHTNCLAALANMSGQFRELHPYVSQRFVSLFETIAKKYQRLNKQMDNSKNSNEVAVTVNQDATDLEQDIAVLEEVMRMVLEILNSCMSFQLSNNPNLIYTLLYNKHMFEAFKDNVVFQDIIHNIILVIQYFSELLKEKSQQHEVDAHQVLLVIQQGAKNWPKEKLTKFPDLKFKYVEEDQPEEFFIPYVWALVSQQSVLHWTNDVSPILTTVC